MAPSQLKRLKTSLRDSGVVGPQKSKKQKKLASKSGAFRDGKVQRSAALQGIREQFKPFDIKTAAKNSKYEFTDSKTIGGRIAKSIIGRPGVTKGLGEESRRRTLLVEMQRRKKVGGILDRRFGENDPTMAPEEKALERFVREKQRGGKKGSLFDLEDAEEEGQLTHFGESLSFDRASRMDDFNEADLEVSDGDLDGTGGNRPQKRRRLSENKESEEDLSDVEVSTQKERFKSKNEVMSEVMAKSKLHKYERQQAKEDDDDLRAELDKGLPDLYALMRGASRPAAPLPAPEVHSTVVNPDRQALLDGKDRLQADKEYDERLRQMVFDQRAKPTEKTITDEEKFQKDAQRLKELEQSRIRRMKGEEDSSDELVGEKGELQGDEDDMDTFGLGAGLLAMDEKRQLDVEDEDEFVIEDNLIASGSDIDLSEVGGLENSSDESSDNDDDREFVQGLLSENDAGREELKISTGANRAPVAHAAFSDLPYTYQCPQSHEELLRITDKVEIEDLPTVIQRIRALYHPKLRSDNKAKLGAFSIVLVGHISFLANQPTHPPFAVLETLIRHIHSLAKTFPEEIGRAFRSHLRLLHEERPTAPTPGDLIILTGIASIFPTSDHFHQVVTPAILCMTRYLSQKVPQSLSDIAIGTYLGSLCLQYQRQSKRYIPEMVNYTFNAVSALAAIKSSKSFGSIPLHPPTSSLRIISTPNTTTKQHRRLRFWDIIPAANSSDNSDVALKMALIGGQIALIGGMADLWAAKPAYCEVFNPISNMLHQLVTKPISSNLNATTKSHAQETLTTLQHHLQTSHLARLPLLLHHHRPLAIKTSIPKFEDSYNPDKHYDPDRDRADSSKLKAEHKRERKGALRELRKDANFIAREELKEKKERDGAYEKKYKRLVAEIQGEEGREAKNYEREKRMRKSKR